MPLHVDIVHTEYQMCGDIISHSSAADDLLMHTLAVWCRSAWSWSDEGACVLDVDECRTFPELCKDGSTCVNTIGSFICHCPRHMVVDFTGLRCIGQSLTHSLTHSFIHLLTHSSMHQSVWSDWLAVVDQRQSVCFAQFHSSSCHEPFIGNYLLKAECCCSIGVAWSDECQFCPRPNTGLFLLFLRSLLIIKIA